MFDRLGNLTAELSSALLKSIVLPSRWLGKRSVSPAGALTRPGGVRELQATAAVPSGPVVLAGGDWIADEAVVAALHLAGGRSVDVLVLPVGDAARGLAGEAVRAFARYGVRTCEATEPLSRERANSGDWVGRLTAVQVVVLVGVSPAAVTSTLYGTVCHQALRMVCGSGPVIVGAAGAAAALADKVLLDDGETEPGLGLLPRVVIDSPFDQGTRFGSLIQVMRRPPGGTFLGIGIDAGAALVVHDGEAQAVGSGGVTVVDSQDSATVSYEPLAYQDAAPEESSPVWGMKVHLLVSGYGINLKNRRPLGPGRPAGNRRAANG